MKGDRVVFFKPVIGQLQTYLDSDWLTLTTKSTPILQPGERGCRTMDWRVWRGLMLIVDCGTEDVVTVL